MFIPSINDDKCSNCKECSKICPKMVLESEKDCIKVNNPIFCTGCEACCAVCPNSAIKVEEV